ncbi:hypothetical protein ACOSQ3_007008 [Xanthoceras sorbifolium]
MITWSQCFLEEFHAAVDVPSIHYVPLTERSYGLVLASYSSSAYGHFSLNVGEALMILRGIQLTVDMGYSIVCVESDVESIVQQLSSRSISCSDVQEARLDEEVDLEVGHCVEEVRLEVQCYVEEVRLVVRCFIELKTGGAVLR